MEMMRLVRSAIALVYTAEDGGDCEEDQEDKKDLPAAENV